MMEVMIYGCPLVCDGCWGGWAKKGSNCANKRYWAEKNVGGEEEVELEAERLYFAAPT